MISIRGTLKVVGMGLAQCSRMETAVRLQSRWVPRKKHKVGDGCGGTSIMISFSATAMWDSQKERFVQQTTHLLVCMGDLHFADGATLAVRKRVKA